MAPSELEDNAYAKIWRDNKEYYGIFEKGLLKGQNNVCDRQEEMFMLFKSVKYPESILVVF